VAAGCLFLCRIWLGSWTLAFLKDWKVNMATKKYKGKSMKPGGGGAFARLTDALKKKGLSTARAKAVAAAAGRKKYGKKRFQKMAATGRKRAARKRKAK
jgi:hypothetical protein